MSRKLFLLLFLFALSPYSSLFAQWELGVKNVLRRDRDNVQLYLQYQAASEATKNFRADIRFWTGEEGDQKVFLRKQAKLTTDESTTFHVGFFLPQGSYSVDVSIYDPDIPKYVHKSLESTFFVNPIFQENLRRQTQFSDIVLSYEPSAASAFERPLLTRLLKPEEDSLFYFMEMYGLNNRALTAKATLFKESGQQYQPNTSVYTSLHQTTRQIQPLEAEFGIFRDTLEPSTYEPGEYMIQILVYDEENLISEEKAWFIVGGNIKQQILNNLEESIRMLAYILPDSTIENLIQEPPGEVQTIAFLNSWKLLYQEDTDAYMEAYYEKVFEANRQFAGESEGMVPIPGWQTNRGRIFIQYGQPTAKDIQIDGKSYLLWTYARWSLSFLFEKQEQTYVLVKS